MMCVTVQLLWPVFVVFGVRRVLVYTNFADGKTKAANVPPIELYCTVQKRYSVGLFGLEKGTFVPTQEGYDFVD